MNIYSKCDDSNVTLAKYLLGDVDVQIRFGQAQLDAQIEYKERLVFSKHDNTILGRLHEVSNNQQKVQKGHLHYVLNNVQMSPEGSLSGRRASSLQEANELHGEVIVLIRGRNIPRVA